MSLAWDLIESVIQPTRVEPLGQASIHANGLDSGILSCCSFQSALVPAGAPVQVPIVVVIATIHLFTLLSIVHLDRKSVV